VGNASFEVARQVLIDIRESTSGWNSGGAPGTNSNGAPIRTQKGWAKLETYTTMEELGESIYKHKGVYGVEVKDGKLVAIALTAGVSKARSRPPSPSWTRSRCWSSGATALGGSCLRT
jgi:hypothetical protein